MKKRLYIFWDERAIEGTDRACALYVVGTMTREQAMKDVKADGRSGCLYSYAEPEAADETFEAYIDGDGAK